MISVLLSLLGALSAALWPTTYHHIVSPVTPLERDALAPLFSRQSPLVSERVATAMTVRFARIVGLFFF